MRHIKQSVWGAGLLFACGANDPQVLPDVGKPEPIVSSVEWEVGGVTHPATERVPYGAQVRIRGSNFTSETQVELLTPSGTLTLPKSRVTETADLTLTVTPGEIVFRYPFPARGEITLLANGLRKSAGSIEPVWMPLAVDAPIRNQASAAQPSVQGHFDMATLVAIRAYRGGEITALFESGELLTINEGHLRAVPGGAGGFKEGALADEFGKGYATRSVSGAQQGKHELVSIVSDGNLVREQVMAISVNGALVAQGSDSGGEYVWVESEPGHVARFRPASTVADRGPFAKPLAGQHGEAAETLEDGTLLVVVGENRHSFFDDTAVPVGAALLPAATEFSSSNVAGVPVDDEMYVVRASRGPSGIAAVHYCALDSDPFKSTKRECRSSIVRVKGEGLLTNESHRWSVNGSDGGTSPVSADAGEEADGEAGVPPSELAPAVSATSDYAGASAFGTVEAVCDSERAVLRVFAGGTEVDSVYPCMDIVGATVNAAGKPVLLLSTQGEVFAVTTRE